MKPREHLLDVVGRLEQAELAEERSLPLRRLAARVEDLTAVRYDGDAAAGPESSGELCEVHVVRHLEDPSRVVPEDTEEAAWETAVRVRVVHLRESGQ